MNGDKAPVRTVREWAEECLFVYMESDYRASKTELAQAWDANGQALAEIIQQAMDAAAQPHKERVAELEEALRFYADPANFIFWQEKFCEYKNHNNYQTDYANLGDKARSVLNPTEETGVRS